MIETIETNLLAPMRRTLDRWMKDEKSTVNTFLGVNGVLTRNFLRSSIDHITSGTTIVCSGKG
jgi:hypothetical protein